MRLCVCFCMSPWISLPHPLSCFLSSSFWMALTLFLICSGAFSLSPCLSLSISLSHSVSLPLPLSRALPLALYVCVSLSCSLSVSLYSLYLSLSLTHTHTHFLLISLSPSFSCSLSVCVCVRVYVCMLECVCLPFCNSAGLLVGMSFRLQVYGSICASESVSLSLALSLWCVFLVHSCACGCVWRACVRVLAGRAAARGSCRAPPEVQVPCLRSVFRAVCRCLGGCDAFLCAAKRRRLLDPPPPNMPKKYVFLKNRRKTH